jgi:hypothetical protein
VTRPVSTVEQLAISVPLPSVLEHLTDAPARLPLLGSLLAFGETACIHGQPREMKSWAAQEMAVAVATGSCAFGLPWLKAPTPRAVLLVGNEDSERVTGVRLAGLAKGHGLDAPSTIHLVIGKGCTLDDPKWQTRLIREAERLDVGLIVLDPLRSLTTKVDQGPAELGPLNHFLRQLVRETGACALTVHHDTKPAVGIVDTRRRAQRASGGGLFSIIDAPIHVEKIDDKRSLVVADGFKHSEDPPSFAFERTVDPDGAIRLVAVETGSATQADELALHEKILTVLTEHPGLAGNAIARHAHVRREGVYAALDRLAQAGKVDSVPKGRAITWFLQGGE